MQIVPNYYKNFKCIANKCKHSCCIGWEIDIDSSSAEYYENVKGDFGEKLKENIEKGEGASFKLKNERCPFLNSCNLCEIIINLGEDRLCQICSDHPRYFEWYSHVKEGGIGLCCEEAARLIVNSEERFSVYETACDDEGYDDYNEELYDMFFFAREEIISLLEDESLTLKERIEFALSYAAEIQSLADNYIFSKVSAKRENIQGKDKADIKGFIKSFENLEAIDDNWKSYLCELVESTDTLEKKLDLYDGGFELYLKNIAVYFIWRYFLKGVYDEEIFSKVMLMAVSVAMIKLMYLKDFDPEKKSKDFFSDTAKNYSKEIEYSEENLEKLYDMVYENPAFGTDNIISII